ncbi:hypothetical protein B9H04_06785 [Halorubrum ezzemoulense DSM 17463]|uniref:Uncharacterized protein n=1 Tax=Halorubrum ezzemoulense DSM 17463 TaxID=1121945 RepID=A0A1X4H8L2_HALEZ|nr:hypothetical protein B9H04_06785 [Halorubrum ezzemoulense DSM 17463]
MRSAPTVKDGTVYVGGQDGTVYAIAADSPDVDSHGSRVLLGTLGHHDERTTDTRVVDERVSVPHEQASADSSPTKLFEGTDEDGLSSTTSQWGTHSLERSSNAEFSAKFCTHCGADLRKIPDGRYCSQCGKPL